MACVLGVIWITQGSPKRQRLFDCVCLRTPCVQRRHPVTLGQHLAPFRYLFANADLLPQYLSRKGGPPEHPIQAAIPILAKRCALYTYEYLCLGDHRDCNCARADAKQMHASECTQNMPGLLTKSELLLILSAR